MSVFTVITDQWLNLVEKQQMGLEITVRWTVSPPSTDLWLPANRQYTFSICTMGKVRIHAAAGESDGSVFIDKPFM